jgi:hypothetical protein
MSSLVDMSFSDNSLIYVILGLVCRGDTSPSVVTKYRLPHDENISFTPPITEPEWMMNLLWISRMETFDCSVASGLRIRIFGRELLIPLDSVVGGDITTM